MGWPWATDCQAAARRAQVLRLAKALFADMRASPSLHSRSKYSLMARKPNYGLNKHRKEQDRKAKKNAKLMDKQQRREERSDPESVSPPDPTKTSGPNTPPVE
jgi:hypothetical protein